MWKGILEQYVKLEASMRLQVLGLRPPYIFGVARRHPNLCLASRSSRIAPQSFAGQHGEKKWWRRMCQVAGGWVKKGKTTVEQTRCLSRCDQQHHHGSPSAPDHGLLCEGESLCFCPLCIPGVARAAAAGLERGGRRCSAKRTTGHWCCEGNQSIQHSTKRPGNNVSCKDFCLIRSDWHLGCGGR